MSTVYIHEVKLASDEVHENAGPSGTVIDEGRTWALANVDPQQSFTLEEGMSGFVVSVASSAVSAVLVGLAQAAPVQPSGEAGIVPVLPGSERYIRCAAGASIYLVNAA